MSELTQSLPETAACWELPQELLTNMNALGEAPTPWLDIFLTNTANREASQNAEAGCHGIQIRSPPPWIPEEALLWTLLSYCLQVLPDGFR